jgi:hypothetical protein
MESLPLSVSIPSMGNGNNPRAPCRAWCRSGKHSVHGVAVSVNVNVCRKAPSVVPPQWATRLMLEEPRLDAAPLVYVRTGSCFLSSRPGLVVLNPRG